MLCTDVWIEQQKLYTSNGSANDRFGYSVSISGNYAVVGAYKDDENGIDSGSIHIFTRLNNGFWNEQQKLTASDIVAGDWFGWSVSISGNYIAVGVYKENDYTGSAYFFARDITDGTWVEQQKLTASDAAISDHFGYSVAISESYMITGARGDNNNGSQSGSSYVYVISESSGMPVGECPSQNELLLAQVLLDLNEVEAFQDQMQILADRLQMYANYL